MRPHIVVTPGDPRGIGPEVALAALDRHPESDSQLSVVGPDGPMSGDELRALATGSHAQTTDADAGRFAARAIERAVASAISGEAEAIVTAPLHKPSLHAAGWELPGQTEMLRDLTGVAVVGMLMAAERTRLDGPLRVLLATTHLPLREVPDAVTTELLVDQISLVASALRRDWAISAPRVGLCGMNPHASDGGLFGDEEATTFEPAIARVREAGIAASGPFPADTVFSRALAGEFDAVVAPYHDIGMAAFKTVSFGTGVNVTIGLPFVRTSPDHGTAFDIARSGRADPTSMLEAVRLAGHLAKNRFDMDSADV